MKKRLSTKVTKGHEDKQNLGLGWSLRGRKRGREKRKVEYGVNDGMKAGIEVGEDGVEVVFPNEVYAVIGAAIEVHRTLGSGFLEAVYDEAMAIEMGNRAIPFRAQVRIPISYKGHRLQKEYIADGMAYDQILIEYKCLSRLTTVEESQIINYLKATGLRVGLLINFGSKTKLEWKRYVLG